MVLGLFGFGVNTSKTSVDKSVINKTISNNLFKNQNTQRAEASVVQIMRVNNVSYDHCALSIRQDATVSIDLIQQVSNENHAQMISDLKQKVAEHMETVMKPKSQLFSPPQVSVTVSKLKERVENVIENNLTVENINEQISRANKYTEADISNVKVDLCPGFEDNVRYAIETKDPEVIRAVNESCDINAQCEISQNVRVTIVAQQLADSLTKSLTEDSKIQELDTKLKNVIEPEAGGLAQLAQFLTPSFGLGSCFLCLCLLVLVVGFFFVWDSQTTREVAPLVVNAAKTYVNPEAAAASALSGAVKPK